MRSLFSISAPRTSTLSLASVAIPLETEALHLLLCGSTGTGKTTAIEELLEGIGRRGQRAIVCDPNGTYFRQFAQAGDVVLNPFDVRSPGWSLFNELRTDFDAERLASSVVPDGEGDAAPWHHYGQVVLAEVMRGLLRRGEGCTERLLHWAAVAPPGELADLLAGTPAAGLLDADAAKALASTRYVVATHLTAHRFVKPGPFSLRTWLQDGAGSIFLTWRADMQKALAPLLATWLDILVNTTLTLAPNSKRRIWLVVDELAAMGKVNSLEMALTLGRKHGLCVIAGLQSTAQLDRRYGRNSAITLRACFRSLLVLGIAKTDPDTCEVLSRALGEREVVRIEEARSTGALGNSVSQQTRRDVERVVLPAEISALPNLTGYLALAGEAPVRPVKLSPRHRDTVAEPFKEDAEC